MKYDIAMFLLFFAGCAGCIMLEQQDRERCIPACGQYAYAGTTQNGQCVCDTAKVKR